MFALHRHYSTNMGDRRNGGSLLDALDQRRFTTMTRTTDTDNAHHSCVDIFPFSWFLLCGKGKFPFSRIFALFILKVLANGLVHLHVVHFESLGSDRSVYQDCSLNKTVMVVQPPVGDCSDPKSLTCCPLCGKSDMNAK